MEHWLNVLGDKVVDTNYDIEWMDLPVEEIELRPYDIRHDVPEYTTKLTLVNENGRYEIEVPKGELSLQYLHDCLVVPLLLAAGYDAERFYDEG